MAIYLGKACNFFETVFLYKNNVGAAIAQSVLWLSYGLVNRRIFRLTAGAKVFSVLLNVGFWGPPDRLLKG